jgi:hypothetical protein
MDHSAAGDHKMDHRNMDHSGMSHDEINHDAPKDQQVAP